MNIPLNGTRAKELLDIAFQKQIPVMVASQGGPREQMPRFRAIGTKWLHVVASVEHAKKAEAAGVDALVVDGAEAGGHPPPSQVGTIVLVRRIVRATRLPVVASGGVADGAGIAALLALGAEAVQLGTRFIATPEASVHDNYKRAVLAADVHDSCLVGPASLPVRAAQERVHAQIRRRPARRNATPCSRPPPSKKPHWKATWSGARSRPGRAPAWWTTSCRPPKSCSAWSRSSSRQEGDFASL